MAGLSLDLIALQLFAGLALGAIYVLFAIGLSLIFGMLTVVNFAHGAFYMVGAYVGLYILMLGGNFWICLIAVPLIVGLFGLVVERMLIRPLHGRGIDYPLLLTFGLSYVMVELVRIAFGKTGFPFDTPEILQGAVNIGVGYFPLYRLFVIGATAAVLLSLWLFLEKTSFGLIIRAGARDPQIVRVLGVNVAQVWLGTFFGPMIGAAAFLLLENLVSLWTVHWQLVVGAIFMICVLFFPAGIWGTLISAPQAVSAAGDQSRQSHPAHQGRRQAVREIRRAEQYFGGILQGCDHLDHRPQRRRKEHLFQSAVRRLSANARHDRVRGPRRDRAAAASVRPYGCGKVVPDHQRVPATDDAREYPYRVAGAGVAL